MTKTKFFKSIIQVNNFECYYAVMGKTIISVSENHYGVFKGKCPSSVKSTFEEFNIMFQRFQDKQRKSYVKLIQSL